jgi:hypothetical protein
LSIPTPKKKNNYRSIHGLQSLFEDIPLPVLQEYLDESHGQLEVAVNKILDAKKTGVRTITIVAECLFFVIQHFSLDFEKEIEKDKRKTI